MENLILSIEKLILAIEKFSNKTWFDYVVTIVPLLLSLVAIGISIYSTKMHNKIALLDKRLAIYTDLKKCIANVIVEGNLTTQNTNKFLINSRDVKFLFDANVEKLCNEIYTSMLELHRAGVMVEAGMNSSDNVGKHEENCDIDAMLMDKMIGYSKQLEEAFYPYIGLKKTKEIE